MSTEASAGSSEIRSQRAPPLRGFWSLFATQFQGAFSDNLFKFLVLFIIADAAGSPADRDRLISLSLALFSLPFVLFSMAGGFLADRYSKRSVVIWVKIAEVFIMALGFIGLWLGDVAMLLGVLFLMSAQSAFFGPSKYGLMPELLPEKNLSWGNGWVGLGTFTAIIAGGVLAGVLELQFGPQRHWGGLLLIALAGAGLFTSLGITRVPPANPEKQFRLNFLGDLWRNLRTARKDRVLFIAILGSTYFWFIGFLFGDPAIFIYSQDVLNLNPTQLAILRAFLAVGIGIGSATAGVLSRRRIEYGLVPLGSMGMAISAFLLGIGQWSYTEVGVLLALMGFSGGFYIVPINALIQHRPDSGSKGSIIAANAWLTSVGVFVASGVFLVLRNVLELEPGTIFLVGACATFAGTVYAVALVPDSLLRLILWLLTNTVYRIRVLGRDHIPEKGGALFVCNHVSFVDALLLLASTDRRVRFLMLKAHYDLPWMRPFARILGLIPISSEQRPREMIQSLKAASDAIRAGDVVCIFAEGQITRTGQMLPFRRGLERIMKGVEAPIIPVALDGVWGSIFSFQKGRFLWKLPRRIPYPITVNYGAPVSPDTPPFAVREKVQELLAEAWTHRKRRMKPLDESFVRAARRRPWRFAMADGQNRRVTFGGALVRAVFLARRLRETWKGDSMVGILLPPSVPGALVNHAAMLAGKIPVNLNYTVSEGTLASCIAQCGIRRVLTSRQFLERLNLKVPVEIVSMEMVGANPGVLEKLTAFLMSCLLPVRLLKRLLRDTDDSAPREGTNLDALATVIFSSGSTGDPKGVMLSHFNIGSNIDQLEQVFGLNSRDKVIGILPFFHSFGFTGNLWLPATLGVGVVFHPNPLDAKAIGSLVREYEVTFLLATPTFLQMYRRGCAPEDFGSLRVVMTGAEKLPDRLADSFEEQFGIRPLEGYGCTECSPAVAVNTHDFRSAGFRQVGGKRGRIGHPLPGVSVRIIDPETLQPVTTGEPGLMVVRGPNVMLGYLGKPKLTADVIISLSRQEHSAAAETELKDRWYVTGDIAALDEDGFLKITDRLSRFSKIGGEMVPHIKVEEVLHECAGSTDQSFVVSGVPDEKKGERLVVLHRVDAAGLEECLRKLQQSELPNLWKPRPDQFYRVDAFPYLGTGKLDLRKIREIAITLSSAV